MLRANGRKVEAAFRVDDDDFDVLTDGVVGGRIMKAAAPVGMSWMWTLMFGYREDRTPTHG